MQPAEYAGIAQSTDKNWTQAGSVKAVWSRPTWLELAHKKLDEAVFAAYGWPDNLSDEEILEKLLALNLQRAKEPGTSS